MEEQSEIDSGMDSRATIGHNHQGGRESKKGEETLKPASKRLSSERLMGVIKITGQDGA